MTKRRITKNENKSRVISIKNSYQDIYLDDHDWVKLGLKLIDEHRLSDAIRSFDRAIKQNPNNCDAFYYKGKCLIWQDKGDLGIECFEKAMELKDTNNILDEVDELTIIDNYNKEKNDSNPDFKNPKSDDTIEDFIKSNPNQVLKILKKEINYRSLDYLNNYNESKIKDRKRPNYNQVNNHKANSNYKEPIEYMHENKSSTKQLNTYEIKNNIKSLKTKLKEGSIELDQKESYMSEIMPNEGGMKKESISLIKQFLDFQRTQNKFNVDYLISNHGGGANYYVEPKYLFRIGALLLEIIIDEYLMDGIVIAIDKPATYIQKILKKTLKSNHRPLYIDCNTFEPTPLNIKSKRISSQSFNNVDHQNNEITYLADNFDFQELRDAIEINFQKVVECFEGEHQFVFIDNINAFIHYATEQEIKKFVSKLTTDLRKFNLFGFFMVPKKTLNVSIFDSIQNLPETISNKFSFWNK